MEYKLSSQSSGISLADVSVNNISDSELEDEDTVLGSNKSYSLSKPLHPPESQVRRAFENLPERNNLGYSTSSPYAKDGGMLQTIVPKATHSMDRDAELGRADLKENQLMPLGDVRFALQENYELLSDQTLLKELLHSLDKKLAATSETIRSANPYRPENPPMSYGPPNKDPGPGLAASSLSGLREPVNQADGLHSLPNGVSSAESREVATDVKILGKHVTFNRVESGVALSQTNEQTRDALDISRSHDLLKQLSCLRWRLAGWEEEGLDPPTDKNEALKFCHKLLYMVQVYQEQKKHLEEVIVTAEGKLKKSQEEVDVLNRLNEKRENRLREADSQIAVIQHEWINALAASRNETLRLQNDVNKLKKERESLQEDLSVLENALRKQKELTKDYQKVKGALEEAQDQFVASRRQTAEIAEENSRLNKKLEDKQKHLQEVEEVRLVSLKHEYEGTTSKLANLEKSHLKLMRTNTHLTDDLRMLHDQHKILLQKVVQEEELKEAALKDKEALEEQVKVLTSKMLSTKVELHSHYQCQVKELVNQNTETLQEQLISLESTLKDSLAEQLDAQREAHRHALSKIQEGHSNEVQDLCNVHSARLSQLQQQIQRLHEENHSLKTQHHGIISAVSSILTPQLQQQNTQALNQILEFPNMASTSTPINTRPVSPQNDKATKGRVMSKNGSRPASGKSGQSNTRVPCLGHIVSSSSDSDGSVFQDGKQTVRHLVGGSLLNMNHKRLDPCAKNGHIDQVRALANDPPKIDCGEYEYRSLPDLQNRVEMLENDCSASPRKRGSSKDPTLSSRKSGSFSGREMSRPTFRKIYRASEILQNDDEAIADFPSLMPADFEMGKLIEELKSIRSSTKTSDSEVPTHDTSFDQDPANITLRKLSQVSTLLSRYVNDAPSSH